LMVDTFSKFSKRKITSRPFPRIPYQTSMLKYGNDKPDLRNPIEIEDVSAIFGETDFKAFRSTVEQGGIVRAIPVKGCAPRRRTWVSNGVDQATSSGSKGRAYLGWADDGVKGPIGKFLKPEHLDALRQKCKVNAGDAVFFVADKKDVAPKLAGLMRTK